ncbi:MAG TPA: hypothetical protein VMH01_04600 [Puia sp.]|nr:hypothetical protein [Puia sp.]
MKYRKIAGCLASLIFLVAGANSQQPAPAGSSPFVQSVSLFQQLPSSSACNESALDALFAGPPEISLSLENAYSFHGTIISCIKPNPFAETINIRLTGFPDALFTVSRIRRQNGITTYTAHILSSSSNDALVLCRKNQKYYFIKTEQRLVLTE